MFSLGALIPLFPFFFGGGTGAKVTALVLTATALLAVGALTALLTGKSPVRSALRILAIGVAATAVTLRDRPSAPRQHHMTVEVREASPDEYPETGRVTALAYREFVRPEDTDWQAYLARIADVAERAQRTVILIAVEDGRILGSATLELDQRTEAEDGAARPAGRAHPHAGRGPRGAGARRGRRR